ncbi:MAG: hypothetical protein HYX53_02105 [Chloroflexi bacterium]|nr:hypothetical protein [Chloroflexota bacterium]
MNMRSQEEALDRSIALLLRGRPSAYVLAEADPETVPYVQLFATLLDAAAEPRPEFRASLRARLTGMPQPVARPSAIVTSLRRAAGLAAGTLLLGSAVSPALARALVDQVRATFGEPIAQMISQVIEAVPLGDEHPVLETASAAPGGADDAAISTSGPATADGPAPHPVADAPAAQAAPEGSPAAANGGTTPPATAGTSGTNPGGGTTPPGNPAPGGGTTPPGNPAPGGGTTPPGNPAPGVGTTPPGNPAPGGGTTPPGNPAPGGGTTPPGNPAPGGGTTPPGNPAPGGGTWEQRQRRRQRERRRRQLEQRQRQQRQLEQRQRCEQQQRRQRQRQCRDRQRCEQQ